MDGICLWSYAKREIPRAEEYLILKKRMAGVALAAALVPVLVFSGSPAFATVQPGTPEAPAVETQPGADAADRTVDNPVLESPVVEAPEHEPASEPELEAVPSETLNEVAPNGAVPNAPEAPAPSTDPAPAAAPVGTRTLSGTLAFPAEVPTSVRAQVSFSLFPVAGYSSECSVSSAPTTFDTATGAFTWTGLPACEFRFSVYYSDKSSGWTMLAADEQIVDLRKSDRAGVLVKPQLRGGAATDVSFTADKFEFPGKLMLVDATGKATDVTTHKGSSGGAGDGSFVQSYVMRAKTGTYTLRVQLNNGKKLFYSATAKHGLTESAAQATSFSVQNFKVAKLKGMDVRAWQKTTPRPVGFTDVPKGSKFYKDITWLADKKITTGVKQKNGSVKFLPKESVTREAMIAFLYRANGVQNYKPKGKSPFVDVKPGDQFYTQIMWAYESKVTTGIKLGNGKRKFDPKATITREAMAAFMYRQYSKTVPVGKASQKFTDIPANHKFAKEIKWMASNKITTGVKQSNGTLKFQPQGATSREATAAFLHRAELKK